jgi:chaperone required for assembly of F1-ATPase
VNGGFLVFLDNRALATPAKADLKLPAQALAEAIAAEWAGQGIKLKPATMPMTQFANTAVDKVAPDPAPAIAELLAYAGTDLLCYRAEMPPGLVERQQARWQPLLDWLALRHDAPLTVHVGVIPRPQPASSLAALGRRLADLPAFTLAGLAAAAQTCGSLVIALALAEGEITAAEAFELAELDGTFQIERWGEDEEAAARRRRLRQDIQDIHRFLALSAG